MPHALITLDQIISVYVINKKSQCTAFVKSLQTDVLQNALGVAKEFKDLLCAERGGKEINKQTAVFGFLCYSDPTVR